VCDFDTYECNSDTHEYDYDTHECDYDTRVEFQHDACDFWTNHLNSKINVKAPKNPDWVLTSSYTTRTSVILTLMRVILPLIRVIFTLMRVISTCYVLNYFIEIFT
jgi:hypothetical protein